MRDVVMRLWRTVLLVLALLASFIHIPLAAWGAEAWPGDTGTDIADLIAAELPSFEPSGVAYHPGMDRVIVVSDEGDICTMTKSGDAIDCVDLGAYDLEGVTIADEVSSLVYLALEHPDSILEFDVSTMQLTGRSWNLTAWLTGSDNLGMEALAYVPNEFHPYADSSSGGLFYAGLQADGSVHVFDVNLNGTSISEVDKINPVAGYTDLADLSFNPDTEKLYGLYDGNNVVVEMDADLTVTKSVTIPGSDQEGWALIADCDAGLAQVFIAWDSQPVVMAYVSYPISCPVDAPVYSPIEYAGNGVDDDGDGKIDEENTLAENGSHPTFATLSPSLSSSYTTAIKSVAAGSKGTILVSYTDNSVYRYTIYNSSTSTRISRVTGTAYYKVRLYRSTKSVRVNALNGLIE